MKQYLSTEIKIAPDEFDEYVIEQGPVQLAFPLREFRVSYGEHDRPTVAILISLKAAFQLAESWSIPLQVQFGNALDPMLVKVDIEGVRGEFIMATIESEAFPLEQSSTEQPPKVKHEPNVGSERMNRAKSETNGQPGADGSKADGSQRRQTMTGIKRKRTSLALVEGQAQEVAGSVPVGSRYASGGDQDLGGGAGPNVAESHPSRHGSHDLAHADAHFDVDFQPNGTLNPLVDMDALADQDVPHEVQQPLFFGTQDDAHEERMATRHALMQQSQAEVDALNPDELAQMLGNDDPDITIDDAGEESYLGPTQHVADEEAADESGNRRSVRILAERSRLTADPCYLLSTMLYSTTRRLQTGKTESTIADMDSPIRERGCIESLKARKVHHEHLEIQQQQCTL